MWTGHTLRGGIDYRPSIIEGPSVKKSYKPKSYGFVSDIWSLLVRVVDGNENIPELDNIQNNDDDHYEEDEGN